MKSNLWCHLKAIFERIWPHCAMRIWRSPTSEGSRRQLFWQLASSSCHFGTPNNQRALYVWVSSDKEQETALISHKKQTDWKKKSWPRVSQSCFLKDELCCFTHAKLSSYISPGFRAKTLSLYEAWLWNSRSRIFQLTVFQWPRLWSSGSKRKKI